MSSQLPPPPAAPAAKPLSIPSMAATTALATSTDGTTTISSLGQDQLLEIFLRLPSLPALVRAALTCRSWLGAVRSSRPFRSLFRALHPAPLIGIFLGVEGGTVPSFAPVRPWVEIGDYDSLMGSFASLVDGSIYCPLYGKGRAIRMNTATMDVSSMYLPLLAEDGDSMVGDTEDGKLCMVYASDDLLHVWIRSRDGDGIESWVLQKILPWWARIDQITPTLSEWEGLVRIVQVRSGCVYLSMTSLTAAGTQRSSFFYLSLETMEIELLIHGTSYDSAYPCIMAWPPCLIGYDRSTEHEAEGSCSCLLKSNNSSKKRKSLSLKETSPVGLANDFNSADVSPLQPNSPDCKVHKK